MKKKSERIFAFVMAMAFLVTTIGVGVAVIMQIMKDNKTSDVGDTAVNTITQASVKNNQKQGAAMDNFTPIPKIETLQAAELQQGTGEVVKAGDTVTVDYTGAVAATGTVFQSSLDTGQPVSFALSQVIPGWRDGLVGMKVGGTRRLFIPAALAYGANPPAGAGIPANADLVFDVVLHKIGK